MYGTAVAPKLRLSPFCNAKADCEIIVQYFSQSYTPVHVP